MYLTDKEKRMYQGEFGPGIQKAMSLLVRYGELFGADKMVPVSNCHISPDIPDGLLQKFSAGVEKTGPICSLHPCLYPSEAERIIGRALTKDDCMAEEALREENMDDLKRAMANFIKLPKTRMWLDYDKKADVLYLHFEETPLSTHSEMRHDGIIFDYRDDRLVGLTILEASKR